MAPKNGYYSVEDFIKQKRQQHQEKGIRVPPQLNVIAAANHIRGIFERKRFEYGLFGGLAMLCLGFRREQPDLHIAYDDKDFLRLKVKLEADQRIRLPEGMNSLFPTKILVRTGPAYKDEGCTQTADIELDLVPPGSHGTPFNGTLSKNLVLLSLKGDGKLKTFKGLNILHLVKTSIHYCGVQDLSWDARKDVLFLCQNYGLEIKALRQSLDQRSTRQNFLGTSFISQLSQDNQQLCYEVLLGTNPPPRMAITPPVLPPGHSGSASTSSIDTRPRLVSHQSSPSLNPPGAPALLSPPIPGKMRATHKRAVSAEVQPSELSASCDPRPRVSSQQPIFAKDSRSRYRTITTPNTRDNSQNNGQVIAYNQTNLPRQHSNLRSPQGLPNMINDQAAYLHRSQSIPIPTIAQTTKSMPNLNAGYNGPLPAYAFGQTPALNGPVISSRRQQQNFAPAVEMSTTPIPTNPGQHHLKYKFGLAGASLPKSSFNGTAPITERPRPPQARASYQEPQTFRAELSGTSMPESHMNKAHLEYPSVELPSEMDAPVDAVHENPRLNVVGPEGLYPANKAKDSTINSSVAVELDATCPISQFIAELSVERATPAPGHRQTQHTVMSQTLPLSPEDTQTKYHNITQLHDSPVSPPEVHAWPAVPTQHDTTPIRPLNPRTQSTPLTALPSSLMAGRPNIQHRVPSHTTASAPTTAPADATMPNTNASRYSTYHTPSYSSAVQQPQQSPLHSSTQSPPQPAYQAYNPSKAISPPIEIDLASPDTATPDRVSRPLSFAALKDVDGANHYFKEHKREKSHDSHASSASHDSRELAEEYRASLPDFESGYGDDLKN